MCRFPLRPSKTDQKRAPPHSPHIFVTCFFTLQTKTHMLTRTLFTEKKNRHKVSKLGPSTGTKLISQVHTLSMLGCTCKRTEITK